MVADAVENGCTGSHCITGGKVSTVFFSIIMGSVALGQVPYYYYTSAAAALFYNYDIIMDLMCLFVVFSC